MNDRETFRTKEIAFVLVLAILVATTIGMLLPTALATRGAAASTVPYSGLQGAIEATGVTTDIGIQGPGFLAVKLPSGQIAYTRNGQFVINRDGQFIVAAGKGYTLWPPITLPSGSSEIVISCDGVISARVSGLDSRSQIGQLRLACFANPRALRPLSDRLYLETKSSGPPTIQNPGGAGAGQILQGFLEGDPSNPSNTQTRQPTEAATSPISWMRGPNE